MRIHSIASIAVAVSLCLAAGVRVHAADVELDEIIVQGRVERLYRVSESAVSKLPTEPLASSQSIAVINEELIRDQGARDALDLYRNIAGVSFFSYAGVTARGFRQEEVFYDGLRGDPYAGFSVPQLFNIERVEFLKGPAGMAYGQAAPGGLFNYVTRTPGGEPSSELTLVGGTDSRLGGSATLNGSITDRLTARVGGFFEERDTHRVNADSRITLGDLALAQDLGPGKLTVQLTRYEQELGGNRLRGVPTDDSGRFLAARNWNHNEASDFLAMDATVGQLRYDARFNEAFSFNVAARYTDAFEAQKYHEPSGLIDANADGRPEAVTREYRDQKRATNSWSLGANGIWSTHLTDTIDNRMLFGADRYDFDYVFDYRRARGTAVAAVTRPTPLSLTAPAYGVTRPSSYAFQTVNAGQQNESRRTGFYVLEEATIGRWVLLAGARRDNFNDRQDATRASGNAWTWRTGSVFRVRDDISFYAQYATSFEPQSISAADPRAGGPFAPTKGATIEGGMKTALAGGRFQSTLAVYEITKRNVLQADPRGDVGGDGLDDQIAFGEVTSRGVDLELATDLTPDWALTFVYAWNDTKITQDNGASGTGGFANRVGERFANAPRHQLGFWTRYQFPVQGLAVAIGGEHLSKRLSIDGQNVKSYAIFDASLMYERDAWSALLRVDNLFDKVYAASGFIRRTGHFPGEPRSAFAELRYRF
jgi:iron complex outermembrane recepter protein